MKFSSERMITLKLKPFFFFSSFLFFFLFPFFPLAEFFCWTKKYNVDRMLLWFHYTLFHITRYAYAHLSMALTCLFYDISPFYRKFSWRIPNPFLLPYLSVLFFHFIYKLNLPEENFLQQAAMEVSWYSKEVQARWWFVSHDF